MNQATRLALAAREFLAECEASFKYPLEELKGRYIAMPTRRSIGRLLRAADAACPSCGLHHEESGGMVPYDDSFLPCPYPEDRSW